MKWFVIKYKNLPACNSHVSVSFNHSTCSSECPNSRIELFTICWVLMSDDWISYLNLVQQSQVSRNSWCGESTPQTAGSFRKVCLNNNTSRTTNMTGWKNHHSKMFLHLLFKIRDFPPSHLSFRGGTYTSSMRTRGLGSQESHHLRCWSQACCIRNTRTSSGSWNFAKDEDKCLRTGVDSWQNLAGICVSTQLLEGKSWKNEGLKTLLGLKTSL